MKTTMLSSLHQIDLSSFHFPMVCVYEKPTDFPDYYVARVFDLDKPTEYVIVDKTLEGIRQRIPLSTPIPRDVNDDPMLVEVWV